MYIFKLYVGKKERKKKKKEDEQTEIFTFGFLNLDKG